MRSEISCVRPELAFTVMPVNPDAPSMECGCGHLVWQRQEMTLGGQTLFPIKPRKDDVSFQFCTACELASQFPTWIVCAECGELIRPGTLVSHGATRRPRFLTFATSTSDGKVVLCHKSDCTARKDFTAGVWNGTGIVPP